MNTGTKLQYQIWSAPTKTDKFNKVWENIKAETKEMVQNERFGNGSPEQNRKKATLN